MSEVTISGALFLLTLWIGMGLMNAAHAGESRVALWGIALEWAAAATLAVHFIA